MAAEGISIISAIMRACAVNGAAAGWPRKGRPRHQAHQRYNSPSMGPRPDGRGRDRPLGRRLGRPIRQWGRGRMAAEGASRQTRASTTPIRQWGRGRMAAEGRMMWRRFARHMRAVNGAAAGWPRKVFGGGGFVRGILRQWGRGRMAAEGGDVEHVLLADRGPSMGPRPDGRGRLCHAGTRHGGHQPSMGPRPDGRGRRHAFRASPTSRPPVNGAAAGWPRKA